MVLYLLCTVYSCNCVYVQRTGPCRVTCRQGVAVVSVYRVQKVHLTHSRCLKPDTLFWKVVSFSAKICNKNREVMSEHAS